MSKIVGPYPPYEGDVIPAPGASWWRFPLARNDDDLVLIMAVGDNVDDPTWVSWEFFDGENTIIDTGFDRPTKVVLTHADVGGWIDVLHEGPPTPSPRWVPLTAPGNSKHPNDDAAMVG